MIRKLFGNTTGLSPQHLADAEKLFRRRLKQEQAASLELVRELSEWSGETKRRIGVLVDRRGRILHVLLGDSTGLGVPPELVRERPAGRFRGLRWIATGPYSDEPREKDLTTLARARFDLFIQVAITEDGRPWSFREAHLRPPDSQDAEESLSRRSSYVVSDPCSPRELRNDFEEFIAALEEEFERGIPATLSTRGENTERAILVTVGVESRRMLERREAELRELVNSAGAVIAGAVLQRREALHPKTLIGSGRAQELALLCVQKNADLVVFSCDMTGTQAKAIENFVGVRVLDRTQIILDLFSQSARSSGGKLQVELARLRYHLPRLAGRGEGLSQIGGGLGANRGIGSNRGVGETKLELDRRAIRRRIEGLEKKYTKLLKRRNQKRQRRLKGEVDHIALVGYTNVGKSTLFNRLTGATVGTADRLFATLDPTVRRRTLPSHRRVVFSDTVGFIEELPQDLARAFGATLEELRDAKLRVHVVDASAPDMHLKIRAVRELLAELELDTAPEILVFNKCDLIRSENYLPLARQMTEDPILVSAKSGEGLDTLVSRIEKKLLDIANA